MAKFFIFFLITGDYQEQLLKVVQEMRRADESLAVVFCAVELRAQPAPVAYPDNPGRRRAMICISPGRWSISAQSRARPPQGLHGPDVQADFRRLGETHRRR